MRLGVVLADSPLREAEHAARLGFDIAWIDERCTGAPLVVAAAVATAAAGIRIGAQVEAGTHPLTLAEEAAVADLASGGRLTLALAGSDAELLAETVDVVQLALAARPFRHAGARWRIPAQLPEHADTEERVRVTPAPAQLELPVWVAGPAAPAVALERMLIYVAGPDPAEHWQALERAHGAAQLRLRRPAVVDVDGSFDRAQLVAALRARRAAWGMDVALVRLPAGLEPQARAAALERIAREVRPRLQLDELPSGLERWWDAGGGGQ